MKKKTKKTHRELELVKEITNKDGSTDMLWKAPVEFKKQVLNDAYQRNVLTLDKLVYQTKSKKNKTFEDVVVAAQILWYLEEFVKREKEREEQEEAKRSRQEKTSERFKTTKNLWNYIKRVGRFK